VVKRSLAALALALAACQSASTTILAPVIEVPAAGSVADPFPGLEDVELAVAVSGDPDNLVGKTFVRGQPLELPGVPLADDLVVHLSGRAGGAEVAYGRTCTLDLRTNPPADPPHLYFARTVKWAPAAAPPVSSDRSGGLAFTAPDGSAFFLDGRAAAGAAVPGVDHFDPRTGAWLQFAPATPRTGAVLATFGDGSALVLGGRDGDGMPVAFYERVNPAAGPALQVVRIDEPGLPLVDHAAATLAAATPGEAKIVVMGGRTGMPLAVTGAVWELSAAAGGGLEPPRAISRSLAIARAEHTLTRLSDVAGAPVLVVGGVDASDTPIARAELYKPFPEDFAPPPFQAQLSVPRRRHAAVRMPDGSVLVIGGLDGSGAAVGRLELFSLDGGFQPVGDLPGGVHPAGLIDFTATPLADGRVLLAGGRLTAGGPPLRTVFIARLDPTDGSVDVVATDSLATARAGHQAVLLCDGTVLLVGGTDAPGAPAERYNPPSIGRR